MARTFWVEDLIAVHIHTYEFCRDRLIARKLYDDQEHERYCREFLEIFRATGQLWGEAYMLYCLGEFYGYAGHFDEAEKHYQESLDGFRKIGDQWGCAWSTMGLAWVFEIAEKYHEALKMWQEHQRYCAGMTDRGGVVYAGANQARLAWKLQDFAASKRYIARAIKSHLESSSQLSQLDEIFRSLIAVSISERHYERAVELSSFLHQHADTALAPAVRYHAHQSLESLDQHLSPDTYQQALERGKNLHLRTILEQLLDELTTHPPSLNGTPQTDALSERELEVLRLTAAGHSNRQIARDLVLALNTVKSHIHHIYGKLGVASRTQAIARARELNLI